MKFSAKLLTWQKIFLILVVGVLAIFGIDRFVAQMGQKYILSSWSETPPSQAAIVLGARVFNNGQLSGVLTDRMDTAIELYQKGKVKKLLLSGDHGQKEYDEVNNMRQYALQQGVPAEDIFMDHAGFSTYDSMYRAKAIFGVEKGLVVTQLFHLPRALYIAHNLGLDVEGIPADRHNYVNMEYLEYREVLARIKAFLQTDLLHSKPKYLGPTIPITADGRITNDREDTSAVLVQPQ